MLTPDKMGHGLYRHSANVADALDARFDKVVQHPTLVEKGNEFLPAFVSAGARKAAVGIRWRDRVAARGLRLKTIN